MCTKSKCLYGNVHSDSTSSMLKKQFGGTHVGCIGLRSCGHGESAEFRSWEGSPSVLTYTVDLSIGPCFGEVHGPKTCTAANV